MEAKHKSLCFAVLYVITLTVMLLNFGSLEAFINLFVDMRLPILELPLGVWAMGSVFLFYPIILTLHGKATKTRLLEFQVVFSLLSLYFYFDAFFVNTDPQSSFLLMFLPLYQYPIIIALAVIIKSVQLFSKKKTQLKTLHLSNKQ